MIEILKLGTHCFWHFLGVTSILYIIIHIPFHTLFIIINRIIRGYNIRKVGYPPPHCDADGDFKEDKVEH